MGYGEYEEGEGEEGAEGGGGGGGAAPPVSNGGGGPPSEGAPDPKQQGKDLGIDLSGEIWVETKADGGKSYYYNATTRATQWTLPQGKDVKILTQDEVEVLQKKMQESGGASKEDGDKAGEDLQEDNRPG